jgi:hypothetical protein
MNAAQQQAQPQSPQPYQRRPYNGPEGMGEPETLMEEEGQPPEANGLAAELAAETEALSSNPPRES